MLLSAFCLHVLQHKQVGILSKEKQYLYSKEGVGLFPRVGLFSGDYSTKDLGDLNMCDDVM